MMDEILLREWNRSHAAFSADIDRLAGWIFRRLKSVLRNNASIDPAYRDPDRAARHAMLSGLVSAATLLLLVIVISVLTIPAAAYGLTDAGIAGHSVTLA